MNASTVLKKAKALISNPESWTQGAFARDKRGRNVECLSYEACCWCAIGSVLRISDSVACDSHEALSFLNIAAAVLVDYAAERRSAAQFNDLHNHQEVLNLFDTAIDMAKAKED